MRNLPKASVAVVWAALLCGLLGVNMANAQDCTVANWDNSSATVVDGDDDSSGAVGSPGPGSTFRRYAGPCGLKVEFGGDADWVEYGSANPVEEDSYIARFYAFLDDLSGDNLALFVAYDAGADQIFSVRYSASTGEIGFDVDSDGQSDFSTPAQAGWNSIEVDFSGAELSAVVNGGTEQSSATVSSAPVVRVRLGDVEGAGSGFADFDDFDSRRVSSPGRLCRGLTDETRDSINADDAIAIFEEAFGLGLASGQPDYDEDGSVTADDGIDVFLTVLSLPGGAPSTTCSDNS